MPNSPLAPLCRLNVKPRWNHTRVTVSPCGARSDREQSAWARGELTASHNPLFLDEADDDDDPEYNFLEDLDEPDTEDFRNDRAVRITSKSLGSCAHLLV